MVALNSTGDSDEGANNFFEELEELDTPQVAFKKMMQEAILLLRGGVSQNSPRWNKVQNTAVTYSAAMPIPHLTTEISQILGFSHRLLTYPHAAEILERDFQGMRTNVFHKPSKELESMMVSILSTQ